jgi:isocitrate dehydrogenase kinase/phosphatase
MRSVIATAKLNSTAILSRPCASRDCFMAAEGNRGMVMLVFTRRLRRRL